MSRKKVGQVEVFGRTYRTRTVAFWLLLGPLGLWLLWGLFLVRGMAAAVEWMGKWDGLQVTDTFPKLGQTGDLFGGVNALFAAYAFVGVAVAAFFQHKTFALIEAQERQQSFEPLFFKLLELNRNLVPRPEIGAPELVAIVNRVFAPLHEMGLANRIPEGTTQEHLQQLVAEAYEQRYARYENFLGPYFRSLYQVFKLINRSGLPEPLRVEYANITRATIGERELYVLAVNCLHPKNARFKVLAEKYGLLKHIDLLGDDIAAKVCVNLVPAAYSPTVTMGSAERESYWQANPMSRPVDEEGED